MRASTQLKNDQPALADHGGTSKSRDELRITITTDGTWLSLNADKKNEAGVDIQFSTDGSNAELTIHTDEADSPLSALRLFRHRPA
jgi:hypothetical protein